MTKRSLSEMNIWINGASRGIGAALVEKLADSGAKLILSASSSDSFKEMAPEYAENDNVFFFPCDIRNEKEVEKFMAQAEAVTGGIDILVNNAGIGKFAQLKDFSLEDFDEMSRVNFRGIFLTTQSVLPKMLEKNFGVIINILSVVVKKPFTYSSIYGATKSAIHGLSASLREEVRDNGIKVIEVYPGATATEIWDKKVLDEQGERMMPPEDVAAAIYNTIDLSLRDKMMIEEIQLRPQGGDL